MGSELVDEDYSDASFWALDYGLCLDCGAEFNTMHPVDVRVFECPCCGEFNTTVGDHVLPIAPKPTLQ